MDLSAILNAFFYLSPIFTLFLRIVSDFQIIETNILSPHKLSHLFNDSCCQKHSQLHSCLCIPAVPSALGLAEVVGQIWQEIVSVKITLAISHTLPLTSPVTDFNTGKGTGPWSREGMQTPDSDRSLQLHQEKYNMKFLWWHCLSGKGVMWAWVQVDKLTPLAERTQPLPFHKGDTTDIFICSVLKSCSD